MKVSPGFVLAIAAAGLGVAYATSSSGTPGPVSIVNVLAGETYKITAKAVGVKMDQSTIDMLKSMSASMIITVESASINDAGDTLTATLTYSRNTKLTLNKLIASTLTPNQGMIITSATRITTS